MGNIRYIAMMGLMLALALVLSIIESWIPPIPALPPGVKLGLANIVTMYVMFFLGRRSAYVIVVLKSGFVLITRGLIAAAMSLGGGLLSATVMLLLLIPKKHRISYFLISVAGAVAHNVAQLFVASIITGTPLVFGYLPVLLISGVVMGSVTGVLLRVVLPAMNRVQGFVAGGGRMG